MVQQTIFMGFKSYKDCLNSEFWQDKKRMIFLNGKDELQIIIDKEKNTIKTIKKNINENLVQCEKCKNRYPIKIMTLHHLNYNCIGSERREDLLVVCNYCHTKIHEND